MQTFRPKKKFEPGTLKYSLHKQAQASLSSGINLRAVVALPQEENLNDWIAVHGKIDSSAREILQCYATHYCIVESCVFDVTLCHI